MKAITFEGHTAVITEEDFAQSIFDVDFNGQMKVQFRKTKDYRIVAKHGMNGYGNNIDSEIVGKEATYEDALCVDLPIEDTPPGAHYQELFDHMSEQHGMTLLCSEMDEIVSIVERMKDPACPINESV